MRSWANAHQSSNMIEEVGLFDLRRTIWDAQDRILVEFYFYRRGSKMI